MRKKKTAKSIVLEEDTPVAPPPVRRPKRKLSLKAAIAAATRREGAIVKPLLSPIGEFPSVKSQSAVQQEMEAHLLELQGDIINREELLCEREKHLEAHELELSEREALLKAHKKLLEANQQQTPSSLKDKAPEFSKEYDALLTLKKTLETQEASLAETRRMLREREAFIEQCENELVEKSMRLTEREAQVEQDEEDAEALSARRDPIEFKAVGE